MERDPQEVIKEAMEGHLAFQVSDKINGNTYKKEHFAKTNDIVHPSDKNVLTKAYYYGKQMIENKCTNDRNDKLGSLLDYCVGARAEECLDEEKMPIAKLVELAIKTMPKKVEIKADVNIGLMSLYDNIDAEDD